MTSPLALLGRGAQGLPPAEPIDFDTLVLPASPNTCLAAPAGHHVVPHVTTPAYALPPAALRQALLRAAAAMPRTTLQADWPDRGQAQWVQRSALMNYPDLINAEVRALGAGSALYLYSRSLFGWSDLGVNRQRVEAWLAALPR